MDATSSARLRPYAGGSSSPRDPLGRKSSTNKSAQTTTKGSAQFFRVRAARSGGGPNGPARRPGGSTNRKSTAHSSSGAPPRAAKTSPDSAHSCWARQQFAASGECNEPRRVAVRRWRRTARLCESQLQRPIHRPRFARFVLGAPPRAADASFSPRPAVQRTALLALPQSTVPCPPHCGSAVAPPRFRRPLGFHLDFANAKRVKSLFRRAGDGFSHYSLFRAPCAIHSISAHRRNS